MSHKKRKIQLYHRMLHIMVLLVIFLSAVVVVGVACLLATKNTYVKWFTRAASSPQGRDVTQQQGTFGFDPTFTPTPRPPTSTPRPTTPMAQTQNSARVPQGLITGGPVSPDSPYYCIDDEDPDGCDDNTAFWVKKGSGGVRGPCGTVIEWSHKIVASLPQDLKGMRDRVNPSVSNPTCNYSTGTYTGGYISTFFVIDSYNLAGFHELSKTNPTHVQGSALLQWWQSQPAGYTFIPNNPTAIQQHASGQRDLTGCVMFLNLSSGVHVGIVNLLELVDTHGNGIISVLQSGARFYLDRFEVVGWNIINTPLHQTQLNSVAGFGCRQ